MNITSRLHKLVIPVVGVVMAIGLGRFFMQGYQESVQNSYALEQATDLVVEYIARNDGTFPRSWEDLATVFEIIDQGYGISNISNIEERITVNFDRSATGGPFVAVVRRGWGNVSEQLEAESNQRIADVLRKR